MTSRLKAGETEEQMRSGCVTLDGAHLCWATLRVEDAEGSRWQRARVKVWSITDGGILNPLEPEHEARVRTAVCELLVGTDAETGEDPAAGIVSGVEVPDRMQLSVDDAIVAESDSVGALEVWRERLARVEAAAADVERVR